MGKIGRNEPCPCGSGKKFKRCCISNIESGAAAPEKVSVTKEVELLQDQAVAGNESVKSIGVFLFISTANGNGWLLELTGQDALLVAHNGQKIDVEILEGAETIEVNWSHSFEVSGKEFKTTAYSDKSVEVQGNIPAPMVESAIRKINKSFSSQLLDSIHVG